MCGNVPFRTHVPSLKLDLVTACGRCHWTPFKDAAGVWNERLPHMEACPSEPCIQVLMAGKTIAVLLSNFLQKAHMMTITVFPWVLYRSTLQILGVFATLFGTTTAPFPPRQHLFKLNTPFISTGICAPMIIDRR